MPASGAAASRKGAAARAEANGKPHKVSWRGLTFNVPSKLPGSVIFDFAALENDRTALSGGIGLLTSILGEEQVAEVREKVTDDGVSLDDMDVVIVELINAVLAAYGMAEGESPASPSP